MDVDVLLDILPEGWIGDESTLECPHGHVIEWDGRCPDGCVSPLMEMGMI